MEVNTLIIDSWAHPWEGFCSSFEKCTQDEADWVSPAYAEEKSDAGWPPTGSILWHLNHVGACKQTYAWQISNPTKESGEPDWAVCPKIEELVASLQRVNGEFIRACNAANRKSKIMGKGGHTFDQFIGIALRHETWHAGQIALIRRLYLHRH